MVCIYKMNDTTAHYGAVLLVSNKIEAISIAGRKALKQRPVMSSKNNTFGYKDESTSLHGRGSKAWSRRALSRKA
jgi:hypothetical protein